MVQESLKERILRKIRPKKHEIQKANSIASRLIKEIQKEGYEAVLVGSGARGTSLSGDGDIDIFVFFPRTTAREDLEKKGLEIGKKILKKYKPETHYAEHPYTKAKVEGIEVEIVPCYKIKDKIISAVDRSPLHNEYVKEKLKEEQADDVLVLKQFIKAANLYGADQKTKGFSGYLCELLILYYKSFDELIKKVATEWNKKIIIDLEKKNNKYDLFKESLVVVDPVDVNRNVASAVSRESLSKFIIKARSYLERKTEEHFFPKRRVVIIPEVLKGRRLILVYFKSPDVIPEILWSQLEKLTKNIKEELFAGEFEVYKTTYWTDEKTRCAMVFEINTYTLSDFKRHKGPEIWEAEHSKAFIEKNPRWWIQRSVLYSWKERKFKSAEDVVENALKTEDLIPSHFKEVVKKYNILLGEKVLKEPEILAIHFSN